MASMGWANIRMPCFVPPVLPLCQLFPCPSVRFPQPLARWISFAACRERHIVDPVFNSRYLPRDDDMGWPPGTLHEPCRPEQSFHGSGARFCLVQPLTSFQTAILFLVYGGWVRPRIPVLLLALATYADNFVMYPRLFLRQCCHDMTVLPVSLAPLMNALLWSPHPPSHPRLRYRTPPHGRFLSPMISRVLPFLDPTVHPRPPLPTSPVFRHSSPSDAIAA
ncbi:hypothetical protein QBC40DRAFT_13092 [Triangularia verruculosa]|uniref:Uncharacterized protein n=1 Tax=Triangularia verruculosa TaxID=2587418 RepID=A0AAN6XSR5_9PEZI|nr:hypothetical protein QBC40DRAFT_13092 [Triangularia verruculosa]